MLLILEMSFALCTLSGLAIFVTRLRKYNSARRVFDLRAEGRQSPRTERRPSREVVALAA